MATFKVRLLNARREPLPDRADVEVRRAQTDELVSIRREVRGTQRVSVDDLIDGQVYVVRAFPLKHRPVGQFVMARDTVNVDVFCPIHPDRVANVQMREYEALDPFLQDVLEASTAVEGHETHAGKELWNRLERPHRAGLLNLFAKMSRTPLAETTSAWSGVMDLYRIRGDRVFANVAVDFRDQVKSAAVTGRFKEADDTLHTPPPGFRRADSFKSLEAAGNLQLTFFASEVAPLAFKVDADIDEAGGLEHGFQVLRNWITGKPTHPYDIHQILLFHQSLDPGYTLDV